MNRNSIGSMGLHFKVSGLYRFTVYGPDGEIRKKAIADDHPNLITNGGMDYLGQGGVNHLYYVHLGSGNTTPSFTDTQLANWYKAVSMDGLGTQGINTTDNYVWIRRRHRFAEGQATGNLSEVGVGWTSNGVGLFSRALIVDEFGSPTTLTILSDETLDVTYEFRWHQAPNDSIGQITFTGNIGGTYDWTFRASAINSLMSHGGSAGGWGLSYYSIFGIGQVRETTVSCSSSMSYITAYNGVIGDITANPSGTASNGSYVSKDTYVPGTYELGVNYQFSLTQGNLTGGISAIKFQRVGIGAFQCGFTPAIPKTSADILTFSIKISWSRYTPPV